MLEGSFDSAESCHLLYYFNGGTHVDFIFAPHFHHFLWYSENVLVEQSSLTFREDLWKIFKKARSYFELCSGIFRKIAKFFVWSNLRFADVRFLILTKSSNLTTESPCSCIWWSLWKSKLKSYWRNSRPSAFRPCFLSFWADKSFSSLSPKNFNFPKWRKFCFLIQIPKPNPKTENSLVKRPSTSVP